jgi:hypothetical protein
MTTAEIAVFSSLIGATASLLTQFVANRLRDKSEEKKTRIELIAEERKLTYMILLNQTSYVQSGITIEYYYQLAVINKENEIENQSLQRHHEEIKFSNSLHAEYIALVGEYCKNIYKLTSHLGKAIKLEHIMDKIINEPHEDFTGIFNDLKSSQALFALYHKEHQLASVKLEKYRLYFEEMRQAIVEKNRKKFLR